MPGRKDYDISQRESEETLTKRSLKIYPNRLVFGYSKYSLTAQKVRRGILLALTAQAQSGSIAQLKWRLSCWILRRILSGYTVFVFCLIRRATIPVQN
jgi:hypothetical protein